MRALVLILLIPSFLLYLGALGEPLMTITKLIAGLFESNETHSLLSVLERLQGQGEEWLFTLVVLFTIVAPLLKFACQAGLAALPTRSSATRPGLLMLDIVSKWSMVDVLVIALMVVMLKLRSGLVESHVEIHAGFWMFVVSVLLGMIVSILLKHGVHSRSGETSFRDPVLASGGQRLLAATVDLAVAALVSTLPVLAVYGPAYFASEHVIKGPTDVLVSFVWPLVIVVGSSHLYGQTLGKWLVGIRIVDAETQGELSLRSSVLRALALPVSIVPAGVGLIPIIWSASKQSLHDRVGGTSVVRVSRARGRQPLDRDVPAVES